MIGAKINKPGRKWEKKGYNLGIFKPKSNCSSKPIKNYKIVCYSKVNLGLHSILFYEFILCPVWKNA